MAELPIMPTATDAFIADTTWMTTEEVGAYWRILCAMWRNGAKLTYDPGELALIAGLPLKRWMKIEARVLRPVTRETNTSGATILTQKRMTRTWLKVQTIKMKRGMVSRAYWSGRKARDNP